MARPRSNSTPLRRTRARPGNVGWAAMMVMLPLATFTAVFLWNGPPQADAASIGTAPPTEQVTSRFGLCSGMGRRGGNCVVDGDTFWYAGEKIRIADINTPEVSDHARCPYEAALGAKATGRLQALLNAGAFALEPNNDGSGRDRDKYGRLLRVVTRNGESVGAVLVSEGLAEEWRGYRRDWC